MIGEREGRPCEEGKQPWAGERGIGVMDVGRKRVGGGGGRKDE